MARGRTLFQYGGSVRYVNRSVYTQHVMYFLCIQSVFRTYFMNFRIWKKIISISFLSPSTWDCKETLVKPLHLPLVLHLFTIQSMTLAYRMGGVGVNMTSFSSRFLIILLIYTLVLYQFIRKSV